MNYFKKANKKQLKTLKLVENVDEDDDFSLQIEIEKGILQVVIFFR